MLCLGIETSCDETAAAVVKDASIALSDVIYTQVDIHRRWGGVVPEVASRNHLAQIMPVIDEALSNAAVSLDDIELLAVTRGPGLQGALLVGLQVTKALSLARGLPFVGVHHLEGHLLAICLTENAPEPPFLGLVVSGGHTALYEVQSFGVYRRLGTTLDDAAGEAYDKVAKALGLPYPGGFPIDTIAQNGDAKAIAFPRALKAHDSFNLSFSGLKTAVSCHIQRHGIPTGQALADVCASFQEAVADILTYKLIAGAKKVHARQLVLCGGVAANSRLRMLASQRAADAHFTLYVPPKHLCTDNAAMIAVAGTHGFARGLRSELTLNAAPSWQLGS